MSRAGSVRLLAAAAAASVGIVQVPDGGAAQAPTRPLARVAGTCRIAGREESLGPTYVTYVGVSGGASCSQALRLVRSFYRCRIRHGGVRGRCSGVEGFRCSENRYQSISVQYASHVTCTRGREKIRHDYTQFT